MVTYYIVARLCNLFTGDCVPIGIFVYDQEQDIVKAKFLDNWDQITAILGAPDVLAEEIAKGLEKISTRKDLSDFVESCKSPFVSLRCEEPKGSIKDLDVLFDWAMRTFLTEG